ncbi:MAG TPA: STAS domain-containing protein [Acidimicrobiia bacterium]|nr:STAS domain-containing protein [Acidimicrobiia bacterium]
MTQLSIARDDVAPDAAVLRLSGELDMASAPLLAEELERTAGRDVERVIVDVAELGFCDSSGLAVLMSWHNRYEQSGRELVLRSPQPSLVRLLEITRVDGALRTE